MSAEQQRLKKEMARVKKEMSKIRLEADSRLLRDRLLESEEAMAEVIESCDSIVAPSGLQFFSDVPFPELGGTTPGLFWAGCLAEESGEYPDLGFSDTGGGVVGSSLNS